MGNSYSIKIIGICIWILLTIFLTGCAGSRKATENSYDICRVFRENRKWYPDAHSSYRKWGVPIPVMMAIMYQESGFNAKAKPPRSTCLFIFPGPRVSSAYGYAQAIDSTWNRYKEFTGNWRADRDDFTDAADFIGWYCHISHIECGIAKNDAYNMYLAYHEGQKGFLRKTYRKKRWLKRTAQKVRQRAGTYSNQLSSCEWEFQKRRGGCCLFPF